MVPVALESNDENAGEITLEPQTIGLKLMLHVPSHRATISGDDKLTKFMVIGYSAVQPEELSQSSIPVISVWEEGVSCHSLEP